MLLLAALAPAAAVRIVPGAAPRVATAPLREALRRSDLGFDEDEVAVMLRHRHPRLVLFFGCGRRASNGRRFLVTEWMAGGSLHDRLTDAESPKPWLWRAQFAAPPTATFEEAHTHFAAAEAMDPGFCDAC